MNFHEPIKEFTELVAWQQGHVLVRMVYPITDKFPSKEKYILSSQMLRASISITANIAEGFARRFPKEKYYFYSIAQGSLSEVRNYLILIKDIGYISEYEYLELENQAISTGKVLSLLMKKTKLRMNKKSLAP